MTAWKDSRQEGIDLTGAALGWQPIAAASLVNTGKCTELSNRRTN